MDKLKECVFSENVCVACGFIRRNASHRSICVPPQRHHKVQVIVPPPSMADIPSVTEIAESSAPGLGDYVANALSAIGITKERVSAAVGGDCGCAARQQAMNEWGRKNLGIG